MGLVPDYVHDRQVADDVVPVEIEVLAVGGEAEVADGSGPPAMFNASLPVVVSATAEPGKNLMLLHWRSLHAAIAASFVLLGCGGAPPEETLVAALSSEPGVLNPAITTSAATHLVTDQIFNGLVGLDDQLEPIPELAESWSIEDDGRTYRFRLRRDVRWHDGEPFTAADVKFTFEEALLRYHSRTRAGLEGVLETIETPDPHTVIFRLVHPYAPLLRRLDVVEASILPEHRYQDQDVASASVDDEPVGTGPFRFVSREPGERIVLEKNEAYFRKGRPYVDRLVVGIVPTPARGAEALERGEIDYLQSVPRSAIARFENLPEIVVAKSRAGSGGSNCQEVLIPNLTRAPFDELAVRRAFYHALDREFLLEHIYLGLGRLATGPISHELGWAYTDDVRRYPHDVEAANRMLDDAGYPRGPDGDRFTVTFTHASRFARLADTLREQLAEVGITLELESLDLSAAVKKVFVEKNFDLGYASFCNGTDPDIGVRRVYVSSNIGPVPFSNGSGYRNPRIDELFERAVVPIEQEERARLYREIQQVLAEDVPYFWLVDSEFYRAHRASWTGFRLWTGGFAETVRAVDSVSYH